MRLAMLVVLVGCSQSLDLGGPPRQIESTDAAVDGPIPDGAADADPDVGPDLAPPDAASDRPIPDASPPDACAPQPELCDDVDQDCDGRIDETSVADIVLGEVLECCENEREPDDEPPYHIGNGDDPIPIGPILEVVEPGRQLCVSGVTVVQGHVACSGQDPLESQGEEWGRLWLVDVDAQDNDPQAIVRTTDCNEEEETCAICPFEGCVGIPPGRWQVEFAHGGEGGGRQSFDIPLVEIRVRCGPLG